MTDREKMIAVIQPWADETLGKNWDRHIGILADRLIEAGFGRVGIWKVTSQEQPRIGDMCMVMKKEKSGWIYGAAQWIDILGLKQWSQGGWTHWKSVGNLTPEEGGQP